MTLDPETARQAWVDITRVTTANRLLPDALKPYASIERNEVDWMGLVERCERNPFSVNVGASIPDRAAVALVAHLLGFSEALRVAPAGTILELLTIVDHDTRVEFMAGVTTTCMGIEL